jgi:hypothetical protein
MRPGQPTGPKHVLKITVPLRQVGYKPPTGSQAHRWPATAHDGIWNHPTEGYGTFGTALGNGNNTNSQMVMGSLLAIPGSVDIDALGLETTPGWQLAWTFQNYGAYIVDNGGIHLNIAVERGTNGDFETQFASDWGLTFFNTYSANTAWTRDVGRIWQALQVVTNNSPTSIGGGGTPRQPLAPPFQ